MKAKRTIGARRLGEKKTEALDGRMHTQKSKAAFKRGPVAHVDANAGRDTTKKAKQ
jgi:hypothetical protein